MSSLLPLSRAYSTTSNTSQSMKMSAIEEIELSPPISTSRSRHESSSPSTVLPLPHRQRQPTQITSDTKSISDTLTATSFIDESTKSSPTLRDKLRRAGGRVTKFFKGPTHLQPLPTFLPLLTLSYSLPTYQPTNSFLPDTALRDRYTSKLRRRIGPFKHALLIGVFLSAWIIGFAFLVRGQFHIAPTKIIELRSHSSLTPGSLSKLVFESDDTQPR